MRIQVHGKQIDVGDALRSHVGDRLQDAVGKYAERPVEAVVTFSREGHGFLCDASVHLSTGMTAHTHARANDPYGAFEGSVERLEKQLRRYKRRLKNHHQRRPESPEPSFEADYSVFAAEPEAEEVPETFDPVIVAETKTPVRSLSVGDAVMQMELAGLPLLVFRNEAHGGVNVVYRRADGNIGWIDPRSQPGA